VVAVASVKILTRTMARRRALFIHPLKARFWADESVPELEPFGGEHPSEVIGGKGHWGPRAAQEWKVDCLSKPKATLFVAPGVKDRGGTRRTM
jgi:hypothetical protein